MSDPVAVRALPRATCALVVAVVGAVAPAHAARSPESVLIDANADGDTPVSGPWTDWKFPSEDDYRQLIDGWTGDSPLAWLNQRTGFVTTTMSKENDQKRLSGHMWLGNSFRPSATGLYVYRVNLSEQDRPGPHVWYQRTTLPSAPRDRLVCTRDGRTCSEPLSEINFNDIRNNYTAQMLLWRPVQPGDYWWP